MLEKQLLGDAEGFFDTHLIESYDYFAANLNDRHSHLAGFGDRLFARGHVGRRVLIGVGDIVRLEKILRHVAEVTGGGAVNYYVVHEILILSATLM